MSAVTLDAAASRRLRLVIVGAGRMGGAVLQGAIGSGLLTADEIAIFHPNLRRAAELSDRFGVGAADDGGLRNAEHILIAVKPQSFTRVAPLVAQPGGSFISLMAGVTAETIAERVGSRRVIRAMPNMGAALGVSATALTALPDATVAPKVSAPAPRVYAEESDREYGLVPQG